MVPTSIHAVAITPTPPACAIRAVPAYNVTLSIPGLRSPIASLAAGRLEPISPDDEVSLDFLKSEHSKLIARVRELRGEITEEAPLGNGLVDKAFISYFESFQEYLSACLIEHYVHDTLNWAEFNELVEAVNSVTPRSSDGMLKLNELEARVRILNINLSRNWSSLSSYSFKTTEPFDAMQAAKRKYFTLDKELKEIMGSPSFFIKDSQGFFTAEPGSKIDAVQKQICDFLIKSAAGKVFKTTDESGFVI